MDFSLSAEQREIQALAHEVAESEIVPHAATWDREHHFPHELIGRLGALGLMGVCVPEEYGGGGPHFLSFIPLLGELFRAGAGGGVAVGGHPSGAALPIPAFCTEEQKKRLVSPLAPGGATI